MKNGRIHLVYLAIIGFLIYQYWAKTQALNEAVTSIEQFDKLLRINTEFSNRTSRMLGYEIEKDVKRYPTSSNLAFLAKSKNTILVADSMNLWLEKQKTELIHSSGDFDKKDSTLLANRLSTNASRLFFSNQKIQEIRDSLTRFQVYLDDITYKEKLPELHKQYGSRQLLYNDAYWESLNNKTNADALAQLAYIQNKIELDKIPFLNYISNLTAARGWFYDAFKVAIAPQKAALIEGETFKADIYIAQYSSTPGSGVTFVVNERELSIKYGVAHFEKIEQKVGKKNIKAEVRIKNPLTGQTTSHFGEFEY